jgi:hypothetical protein
LTVPLRVAGVAAIEVAAPVATTGADAVATRGVGSGTAVAEPLRVV